MTTVIIILLVAAIILFVLSFMQKSDNKQLENELEEVASQLMHENYELKKRITALEKAMNVDSQTTDSTEKTQSPKMKELLKKQVITLYTSGISTEEIIAESALPQEEVEKIIEEYLEH